MFRPIIRQTTGRRAFSIISTLRSVARSAEPHPFARLSSQPTAKADWAKQVRHLGDAGKFYIPFMGLFVAWPLLVEQGLDGHM